MMRHRLSLLFAAASFLMVASCAENTFRARTVSTEDIDGQSADVSWIRLDDERFDLIVRATPTESGSTPRLDVATAQQAAEQVAKRHCWLHTPTLQEPAVASFAQAGSRAFRYRCGGASN